MDDFLKKYLGRMTVSQKQRTLLTWAQVPVARFALINLGAVALAYLPAMIPDVLPWQLENVFHAVDGPLTWFCGFNLVALSVFWKLRRYARNHTSIRHKFRKTPAPKASRPA